MDTLFITIFIGAIALVAIAFFTMPICKCGHPVMDHDETWPTLGCDKCDCREFESK